MCFFVLCNRHWFNKAPGPDPRGTELGVAYLPSTISSDAGYADLPLALLGAPVDIGALVKPGSRSLGKAKTETGRPLSRDRTTWTLSASSGYRRDTSQPEPFLNWLESD